VLPLLPASKAAVDISNEVSPRVGGEPGQRARVG